LLHVAALVMDEIERTGIRVIAEREVNAPDGGQNIGDDAVAFRVAGDVIEQHGGITGLALIEIDNAANLFLAAGAMDMPDLARFIHFGDPASQILRGHISLLPALTGYRIRPPARPK